MKEKTYHELQEKIARLEAELFNAHQSNALLVRLLGEALDQCKVEAASSDKLFKEVVQLRKIRDAVMR